MNKPGTRTYILNCSTNSRMLIGTTLKVVMGVRERKKRKKKNRPNGPKI